MPHRHKCFYCGKRAVASDVLADGQMIYICVDHIPVAEPLAGRDQAPAINKTFPPQKESGTD